MSFWTKLLQKQVFSVENGRSEYHYWILHFQISRGTKFQLKLSILIFWTKFTQKQCFWSEKVNISIELCIFQLVWVPNFSLDKQFYLGSNFAQKWSFQSKTENSRLCECSWSFLTISNFFARGRQTQRYL